MAAKSRKKKDKQAPRAVNKKAYRNFELIERFEAGLELRGSEVRISFDSVEGLECKRGYKCVAATAEVVADDVREGAEALWDDFRIISPVAMEKIERAANVSGTPATVSTGETALWLDELKCYIFSGMLLAGRWLEPSVGNFYPTFTFVGDSGSRKVMKCSDAGWKIKAAAEGSYKYGVTYSCDGATMKVLCTAEKDAVQCEISVVSEGGLKAAQVGAEWIFAAELTGDDYGIPPTGFLVKHTKGPVRMRGLSEARTPLFMAAKSKDAILYYKPLTASQQMKLMAPLMGGDHSCCFARLTKTGY